MRDCRGHPFLEEIWKRREAEPDTPEAMKKLAEELGVSQEKLEDYLLWA